MKQTKGLLIICMTLFVFNFDSFGQQTLPEVTIVSMNYKYLKSVQDNEAAEPVKLLEHYAATFDIKSSDFYEQEYDNYFVSFYIPDGEILAFYDKDGKITNTAEKYKNVKLPANVRKAVAERYPNWTLAKDVYIVNYYARDNSSKKIYKMLLENGTKRMRVKANDMGQIID
jgi:hypothetical protein